MAFSKYIDLLSNLSDDTKPAWGIMTAQHMVEHLTMAIQSSTGKIVFDRFITPEDKMAIAKRFLHSSRPFPKLFVNEVIGEGLKPLINPDLSTAFESLKKEELFFEEFFIKNPNSMPINATFGPLDHDEWIAFHNKQFTQFELIST